MSIEWYDERTPTVITMATAVGVTVRVAGRDSYTGMQEESKSSRVDQG